jgi:glycosyltransferase involved in cell wall biosynthesis
MQRVPSVVSIDATQDMMLDIAGSAAERWSYMPNIAMDGRVFRAAAAIVSTSRWAASCLHRRYPDCTTPVYVMPTPVRVQFLDERWIEERYDRAAAPGYMPRVLFVGGAFVRKGGPDLLAAWRDAELYRVAKLDLVTDWPVAPPAMPGVRVLRGVESYSSDWSELWRAADIFVLPTHHEAFATAFQEAGAAGLPRIATNIYAIPETIADGDDGLLVRPGDRRALAVALKRLIESRDLRFTFGSRARRRVTHVSSPSHYVSQLKDIMLSVAKRSANFRLDTPA